MSDRTPTTAAGRALEQRLAYDCDPAHYEPGDFFIDDRRDILAIEAEARAPLDMERVGRIFHDRLDQSVLGHAGPVCQPCWQNAKAFAREYAALEEPTP